MLNLQPLREQVYQHLRREMQTGDLLPGLTINLNKISQQLGISKTPLRDALIQLETEGFVIILPRRGFKVKGLTLTDIKNLYEILGALESSVIISVFDKLDQARIEEMERFNTKYREAVSAKDFEQIYQMNLSFHDAFLELSDNKELQRLIKPLKQRLYDFPRRAYLPEWELRNADEHQRCIDFIKKGNRYAAARTMRDAHWSYVVQEKFIREFYALGVKEYKEEMANLQRAENI